MITHKVLINLIVDITVKARARENRIEEIDPNRYIVYLTAPADKGKANLALIKLMTRYFKKKVSIIQGFTRPHKKIKVED